ncbi:fatty acid desaturase [Methylacidiphilum sp. Yel]|jgi:omega-6 fatty acid desaturase (delta-12 desaturase)|uniref:fatty acid desaturase family protein n=1 Tax=Methylacidiphilum sp. Yel TaxID=1847730 RepID=UPI00106A37E1|nr:fatty acid desaturase [Methylacidiphilum sp. Yel]TFE66329.1 fatty acid desaturase [Methylacidiphilum sp. Yel]
MTPQHIPIRSANPETTIHSWKAKVLAYQKPSLWKSLWQLVNTLIPYAALWYLIYLSLPVSVFLVLLLVVLCAAFQIRIFSLFHDCCHSSFFKSKKANEIIGTFLGILVFTPYHHWKWEHSIHHGNAGNLDKRGIGDMWTWTVKEYLASPWWRKLSYRILRHPLFLFGISPLVLFLIKYRFASKNAGKKARQSVLITNVGIFSLCVSLGFFFGWQKYIPIQLMIVFLAGSAGIWLFYVQHQFEEVYWERGKKWDFQSVALEGSSFYKLPKILEWITASIGYHHVHHLSPQIPNYFLKQCHKNEPIFEKAKTLTLLSSLRTLNLHLWDEDQRKMVSFKFLRTFSSSKN